MQDIINDFHILHIMKKLVLDNFSNANTIIIHNQI